MFSPFHSLNLNGSMFSIEMMLVFGLTLMLLNLFIYKYMMFWSMCFTIIIINFSGLIPFNWCMSSYMWSNLMLSIFLWFCFFMAPLMKNLNFVLSHLLPVGSPMFLWYFLVSLEIISQLIRPLTLSLRLMCNMMAGHVLISLINNLSFLAYFLLIMITLFELMVSMIQSLVYSMLNFIYKQELFH